MKDIFKERSKTEFVELIRIFSNECEGNIQDFDEESLLNQWLDHLNQPLPKSKQVRYSKALERILGTPGSNFHACAYRDVIGLKPTNDLTKCMNLEETLKKYNDSEKSTFWKYIDKINACAFESMGYSLPRVPTRQEIHNNIKSKKHEDTGCIEQPSMSKAFQQALIKLEKEFSLNADWSSASESQVSEYITRWNAFTKETVNDVNILNLCNDHDNDVVPVLRSHFSDIPWPDVLSKEQWEIVIQLNSYSSVGKNIPVKMMGRIENMASKLADEIVSGKRDLGSMDLNDIGQQVLSGCDQEDMNSFAENIEQLLPAIQGFQNNIMKQNMQ